MSETLGNAVEMSPEELFELIVSTRIDEVQRTAPGTERDSSLEGLELVRQLGSFEALEQAIIDRHHIQHETHTKGYKGKETRATINKFFEDMYATSQFEWCHRLLQVPRWAAGIPLARGATPSPHAVIEFNQLTGLNIPVPEIWSMDTTTS